MLTNLSIGAWHDETARVKCEHHHDMPDQPCLLSIGDRASDSRHWMTEHTLEQIHKASGELLTKLRGERAAADSERIAFAEQIGQSMVAAGATEIDLSNIPAGA